MALPILDGNQTAVTLATTVSGGAHYPNHIIASGIVTVENSVTISSLPNISGTVTANVAGNLNSTLEYDGNTFFVKVAGRSAGGKTDYPINVSGTVTANINGTVPVSGTFWQSTQPVSLASVPTHGVTLASTTVTVSSLPNVTIGNSSVTVNGNFYQATQPVSLASVPTHGVTLTSTTVTVSSLPSISGTVTANLGNVVSSDSYYENSAVRVMGAGNDGIVLAGIDEYENPANIYEGGKLPISGTVTVGSLPAVMLVGSTGDQIDQEGAYIPVGGVNGGSVGIVGTVTANAVGYDYANQVEVRIPVSDSSGSVLASIVDFNGSVIVPISGTVTANTIYPKITFIDGSGSVATANSAVEVFATSSTRSYLLVQVTTGFAYVNVGATATTANGIYLGAGQGYAWETIVPQGIVSLISSVTGTAYCAKQA